MLLNFSFENFKSYRGMQEFFMAASDDPSKAEGKGLHRHDERLISHENLECKILPVTAIFGGNAFGKSNFVDALLFLQILVLEQLKEGVKIPTTPFFLDPETKKQETSFDMNILSAEKEYELIIKIKDGGIIEEKVSLVKGKSIENIYHRKEQYYINPKFDHDGKIKIVLESSRDNTLMLSSQIFQGMKDLEPIYRWFNQNLLILSPRVQFNYLSNSEGFTGKIGKAMNLLDTGVESLKIAPVTLTDILTRDGIEELRKSVKSSGATYFKSPSNDIYVAESENGDVTVKSLNIIKKDWESTDINLKVSDESDGTQRLLNILPAILQSSEPGENKVLIIDELDRSLHTDMTRALVNYHLSSIEEGSKSQLIFTTHDVNLIDLRMLRNDEIWIIRKNHKGVSEMTCLVEFTQQDPSMNFQNLYIQHNLGGTPRIQLSSNSQLTEMSNTPHLKIDSRRSGSEP